jgi:hypothetical protein
MDRYGLLISIPEGNTTTSIRKIVCIPLYLDGYMLSLFFYAERYYHNC